MDGNRILDLMLVSDGGVEFCTDVVIRSWAAQNEFVICTGYELVCITFFGREKWKSIKKYIITRFVDWSFAYTAAKVVFVATSRLSSISAYICSQIANEGF